MTETNYNNGKDLMPVDIVVEQIEGKYCAKLGFLPYQGMPKFYIAWGTTEQEAKEYLVDILKEHLDRAIKI